VTYSQALGWGGVIWISDADHKVDIGSPLVK
jgi:hypothetical protein